MFRKLSPARRAYADLKKAARKTPTLTSTLTQERRDLDRLLEQCSVSGMLRAASRSEPRKDQGDVDDLSSWVPANTLWQEKFSKYKDLTRFRQQHPEMFRNPSEFKLEIHAGLWARHWASRDKAGFEALNGELPSVADDPAVQRDALAAAAQRE